MADRGGLGPGGGGSVRGRRWPLGHQPGGVGRDPAVVEAAHAAGLKVVAWTVDDPDRMTALAAMGVDVLVTDRPALALVVRRHDGW